MSNTGAGANKVFVAPVPDSQKNLKRLRAQAQIEAKKK